MENKYKEKIKLHDLVDNYLKFQENKIKSSTLYVKKLIAENWIKKFFPNAILEKISYSVFESWIDNLQKQKMTIGRINRIITELRLAIEHGEKFFGLTHNPVKLFGKIKDNNVRNKKMKIWSIEEFNKFIENIDDPTYHAFFFFLYYTGCRLGEVLALKWEDVNFFNGKVNINKTLFNKGLKRNEYALTSPKTNSSNRQVQLNKKVLLILSKYKNYIENTAKIKIPNNKFLFGIDNPLPQTSIKRLKDKTCEKAELPIIRLHDFRHSHASLLISLKVDPLFIADRLGHSNVSTTLDTYSHLFPVDKKK